LIASVPVGRCTFDLAIISMTLVQIPFVIADTLSSAFRTTKRCLESPRRI
jgi:hypothetical protein